MNQLVRSAALLALACFLLCAQPQITGVVNSASFQSGLPSGGALATVFCSGVVSASPGTYLAPNPSLPPTTLAGFQVNINLANAPILAVVVTSAGGTRYAQINFQVPIERNASLIAPQGGGYAGFLTVCGGESLIPLPSRPVGAGSFFSDAKGYAMRSTPPTIAW